LRTSNLYPESSSTRNVWIVQQRGPKNILDPWKPYAFFQEEEFGADGRPVATTTVLLTNKECPYRCLMCDLWRNTLDERVPPGAIPAQIRYALETSPRPRGCASPFSETERGAYTIGRALRSAAIACTSIAERGEESHVSTHSAEKAQGAVRTQIKLYNAGSFFDTQAIPPEDYAEIAECVAGFDRVIVECHPLLIDESCLRFRDLLSGKLEIAIGLETVHALALEQLNKRFTVGQFRAAAGFLSRNGISLRVFLLLRPPFLSEAEGLTWARRSLETALQCGASVCCLIPTRGGNGAMETLASTGDFAPPDLKSLEAAVEYGLSLEQGRIFADLWDIEKFHSCLCSPARTARLVHMNRTQQIPPPIHCPTCQKT
jgi:uncharacterized Fe-S cluster-containing MiaB family protein